MQSVVIAFFLSVVARLSDIILWLAPDVESRDTDLGEFKIVGPEESSLLRFTIRFRHPSRATGILGEEIVEGRVTRGDIFNVARLTPGINAVDVDVGQSMIERVERIFGVIFCS